MARAPHGGILRSSRTLAFFSVRRAIDMKVLTDLSILRGSACGCLKQDVQDGQDAQDERGLGAAQGSGCSDTSLQVR